MGIIEEEKEARQTISSEAVISLWSETFRTIVPSIKSVVGASSSSRGIEQVSRPLLSIVFDEFI